MCVCVCVQDGFEAETVLTVGILFMSLFDPVHAIKLFLSGQEATRRICFWVKIFLAH